MQTKETGKQKSHSYSGKEGSRITMAAYAGRNERKRETSGKNWIGGNGQKEKGGENPPLI